MDQPLQISFRNMDRSDAVEAAVRERVDKLERYVDHITSCQVMVEAPHRQHHKGKIYHIRIEIGLPGRPELVISRDPAAAHAHEDIFVAVRDAFDAADRQVEEMVRKRRRAQRRPRHPN